MGVVRGRGRGPRGGARGGDEREDVEFVGLAAGGGGGGGCGCGGGGGEVGVYGFFELAGGGDRAAAAGGGWFPGGYFPEDVPCAGDDFARLGQLH